MSRFVLLGLLAAAAGLTATPPSGAGEPPAWKPKATQEYLDKRAAWWLDWSSAARGQGTSCVSCHTAVPYGLARPALAKLPGVEAASAAEKRLLASINTRVEKWAEVVSAEPEGKDPLVPFYQGGRWDTALDTESVLNAVVLVNRDLKAGDQLAELTGKALDHMWARQQPDGSWRWLDFGLRPWEKEGEYYGASLAAVAAGAAGEKYPRHNEELPKKGAEALRKYLKEKLPAQSLHNRAFGLLADSYLKGTLSDAERKAVAADLFALQRADGGWGLADLGKTKTAKDSAGWLVFTDYRDGAAADSDAGKGDRGESDGYATGLVVLALKRAGRDVVPAGDERLKKAVAWLVAKQAADGTWPAAYVNRKRTPTDDERGQFMRDAGAAFAALALAEPE